ncbi:MAG: class I SAM-dependent methyltransferase [Bacteroidetes bacterium]|nr:class I SAM-dependent methyltransferase [Bacteroidota bacterium]
MMFKKYNIAYSLDDPRTTIEHRNIILNKPFLKRVYIRWYNIFLKNIPEISGVKLEVGSGGGFLKEVIKDVETSDILDLPNVDKIFSAEKLPYANNTLSAIMMLNVFHHIPKPYLFLEEAQRCLKPGGRIVMIEPANTLLAKFIYKRFHHEPFDISGEREIKPGNPLSNSNQALPYIYFERDKDWFLKKFNALEIKSIKKHSPFMYILSGGVSRSAMLPDFLYTPALGIELLFSPLNSLIGLFSTVVIEKKKN